jgi:hypothetical protein
MSCEIKEWTSLCFARLLHDDIKRFIKSVEEICRSDGVIMANRTCEVTASHVSESSMSHDGVTASHDIVIMENRACEVTASHVSEPARSHDIVIMENRACEVPALHDGVTLYNSQGEHCQVYLHRDGDKGIRILVNSARPLRHFREEYSVKTLDSFILHLRNFHGISYFTKGPSIVWSGAKYLLTKRLNPSHTEIQGRMTSLPSETEPVRLPRGLMTSLPSETEPVRLPRGLMTSLQIPSRL